MTTTPEDDPAVVPSHDPTPLDTPDPDNPDHPHGRDAELSGPDQPSREEKER